MRIYFKTGIFFLCLLLLAACKDKTRSAAPAKDYDEQYRPQFHFSPPTQWMNDPNGLVYFEGEYHLFYQYYPEGNTWGPMHWGHAVSKDMVHWENLPIALYPDSLGYIFSGSAVVDWKNTSGLGKEGEPAMVAIFTYHNSEGEKAGNIDFQNQGVAYSNDKGRSWTKYKGNPVLLNPGIRDFRDPKVIWHQGTKRWVMALAVKDRIQFYSSPNLLDWSLASDFNPDWAAYGGVWECPDLFPLKTPEGNEKWVLLVSINPGAPNGGSGTQYFVGEFDGKEFKPTQSEIKWLDYGADNYAGVTWSDIPASDGRRLFIGWMSNWLYAQNVPTTAWRSAMTVPRGLQLQQSGNEYQVVSRPVEELRSLRVNSNSYEDSAIAIPSDNVEIDIEGLTENFELRFSNAEKEEWIVKKTGDSIFFDRSRSGQTSFHPEFSHLHSMPVSGLTIRNLKIYLDRSSVELFFNNGERVMTELLFPNSFYSQMHIQGIKGSVTMHDLKSIWR
jgi:fructan beta-fructosidase